MSKKLLLIGWDAADGGPGRHAHPNPAKPEPNRVRSTIVRG